MIRIKLLQFELKYYAKQRSTLVFLVLFILYGILSMVSEYQFLEIGTMYNDAFNLSLLAGVISIGALFPCLFLCINGLLRDQNHEMEEIICSTGIAKNHFFISRFLAIFIITLLLSSLSFFGVLIGTFLSESNPEKIHVFSFLQYVWPWLLLIVPNAFILSVFLFSATLLSKKAITTYIIGVVIIGIYWFSAFTINSPLIGGSSLSSPEIVSKVSLIDIMGLAPFFEQTQFLTPVEKNDYLISFSGHFLWNRMLWVGLAFIVLLITYKLFSFRKINSKSKKELSNKEEITHPQVYKPVKTLVNTTKTRVLSFWSLTKIDVISTVKSIPFLALTMIWIVMLTLAFNYATNGIEVYGSRYPTTDLLLGLIIEILPVFGLLLIVYYSGELLWKSRSRKFDGIIDATPVKNTLLFGSKLAVLIILPLILIILATVTGMTFQIANGYFDFNISLYLSTFYYGGLQLVLYAIFCLFVQAMVPNKYLSMVISGVVIFFFGPLSENIGLEHPLLLFNNTPSMARAYSDFTGYGHYISKFNWLALYWTLFSGLFVLLSYKFWKRGISRSIKLKATWSFKEKIAIGILLLLFSTVGGFIFYNTNIVNNYVTANEAYDFNEHYERKYKKYDVLAVPKLRAVSTKMDIYPTRNAYAVTAESYIENNSSKPMNEIFVTEQLPLSSLHIENGTQMFHDSILHTYLFELKTPLLPNQQLKMSFNINKASTTFSIDNAIAKNGSYIKSSHFSPLLGYANQYEINDPFEREQRGLPIQENVIINDEHLGKNAKFNYEDVAFETVISTDVNQVAFSSGELMKQWKTEGRNYYHYKSTDTIDHMVAYFSGEYQVEEVQHRGVNIELYYLPNHYRNVAEMIKVTKATIDYCTDNFGTYPHKYLRIGEMSTFGGSNGQAMPGVISINETIFKKSIEDPDSFNVIARVLVHEISHQWWGLLVTPKRIEGALFISESFAKYSEIVILEKLYGKTMVNRLSEYTMRKYFSGRSRTNKAEPPLYLTAQEQYLGYSKGAITLNAIRGLLGERALNTALKNVVSKYNIGATVTSLNFLEELYEVSSEENHILIDDWIKRVITYDVSIETATYKKLKNNKYEVTANISAMRFKTNSEGKEDEIDIDEPITIGVYKSDPKSGINESTETLYLKPHLVNKNKMELNFIVNEIPKYISIDPNFTRLDRTVSDNIKLILPE